MKSRSLLSMLAHHDLFYQIEVVKKFCLKPLGVAPFLKTNNCDNSLSVLLIIPCDYVIFHNKYISYSIQNGNQY